MLVYEDLRVSGRVADGAGQRRGRGMAAHPAGRRRWPVAWGAPYTLRPTPHTLYPGPYTIHPTPYTLHPIPYTLDHQASGVVGGDIPADHGLVSFQVEGLVTSCLHRAS